jgi:hypothetical protein
MLYTASFIYGMSVETAKHDIEKAELGIYCILLDEISCCVLGPAWRLQNVAERLRSEEHEQSFDCTALYTYCSYCTALCML